MMKPVAILQHENHMGPGSLQDCLSQIGIPMQMFSPVKGEAVPRQASEFSGIVLLGSERSALDAMPWIRAELGLCKDALAHQLLLHWALQLEGAPRPVDAKLAA